MRENVKVVCRVFGCVWELVKEHDSKRRLKIWGDELAKNMIFIKIYNILNFDQNFYKPSIDITIFVFEVQKEFNDI